MGFFASVGKGTMGRLRAIHESLAFLGEATVCTLTALVRPRQFRFADFLLAFQRATFDGLPISTGIGFLLGVILAFQSAAALQQFGGASDRDDMTMLAGKSQSDAFADALAGTDDQYFFILQT